MYDHYSRSAWLALFETNLTTRVFNIMTNIHQYFVKLSEETREIEKYVNPHMVSEFELVISITPTFSLV